VKEGAKNARDKVSEKAEEGYDKMKETGQNAKEGLHVAKDTVAEKAVEGYDKMKETAQKARDTASEKAEQAKDSAHNAGEKAKKGAKKARDTANEKLEEGEDEVEEETDQHSKDESEEARSMLSKGFQKVGEVTKSVFSKVTGSGNDKSDSDVREETVTKAKHEHQETIGS